MHNIQTEYDHKIKGYGRNTTYCSWLSGVQSGLTKLKDVYLYMVEGPKINRVQISTVFIFCLHLVRFCRNKSNFVYL